MYVGNRNMEMYNPNVSVPALVSDLTILVLRGISHLKTHFYSMPHCKFVGKKAYGTGYLEVDYKVFR